MDTIGRLDHAPRRSPAVRFTLAALAVIITLGFLALGTWQLFRLQWKLDLIHRVNERVHAAAAPAPGPALWPSVNATNDEYRHVSLSGHFLAGASAKVQAVTELGSGYWLLTPLCGSDGTIVIVNRGFITAEAAAKLAPPAPVSACAPSADAVKLTGLLRISEPGGGFLRHNDPVLDHWYSRDVAAIASARHLAPAASIAPYFVDADAGQEPAIGNGDDNGRPVGGLTVIAFHNSHLVYAITWYALALMMAGVCFWVAREERRAGRR